LNIINCDGVENLLKPKYISTQLKTPNGLTHLGIIMDADEEPDNRWKSLYNACLPNIPSLPQNLPAAGLIMTLESGIKFGVWMMPDNQSRGMLETFLAYLETFDLLKSDVSAKKSDWDHQKPGIILIIVHGLVQKREGNKA